LREIGSWKVGFVVTLGHIQEVGNYKRSMVQKKIAKLRKDARAETTKVRKRPQMSFDRKTHKLYHDRRVTRSMLKTSHQSWRNSLQDQRLINRETQKSLRNIYDMPDLNDKGNYWANYLRIAFITSLKETHKLARKQTNQIKINLKKAIREHQEMDLKQANEIIFENFIKETAIYDSQSEYNI
jgi:hypothetical protein